MFINGYGCVCPSYVHILLKSFIIYLFTYLFIYLFDEGCIVFVFVFFLVGGFNFDLGGR